MIAPGHIAGPDQFHADERTHLELLLRQDPRDRSVLEAYFDLLSRLSRARFGVMYCIMPNVRTPVAFRAHTSDIHNMRQVFLDEEYRFEIVPEPRRILDLGAYCGYAALYFANKYENARIMCVEPSAANFAVLMMNTVHYHTIRRVQGAAWNRAGSLALERRVGGHWGSMFGETKGNAGDHVAAYTVPDLLGMAGWTRADFVKVDIEGAEREVFSSPHADNWIALTSCVSVETHERLKPGSAAAVEAALPASQFDRQQSGEFMVYRRRCPVATDENDVAEPILLGAGSLRSIMMDLINVPSPVWGFEATDDETCQLHPNPPGDGPAELHVRLPLQGYNKFTSMCHLAGTNLHSVIFSARVQAEGVRLAQATVQVESGAIEPIELILPLDPGAGELVLATEMAPGASDNGYAWARWCKPMLT